MSSLYKRASLRQALVMRMIAGAVKNAADCHPEVKITSLFARSVAKRATGTLSAQWADVLALPREVSVASIGKTLADANRATERQHGLLPPSVRRHSLLDGASQGRGSQLRKTRAPLVQLHATLGYLAGIARKTGNHEEYNAYVTALKIIGAARLGDPIPTPRQLNSLDRLITNQQIVSRRESHDTV